jgi:tellurite resistance protein TehA-like permease
MVMASGIVSVAAHQQRRGGVSAALAIVAAVVWAGLVVLSGARMVLAADLVRADLDSPARQFDFCTFVAAADVLGVRAAVAGWDRIGVALLLLGALAWLALAVTLPTAMRRRCSTPVWWAASGNWLLAVVATQSLAVLAGTLAGPGGGGPLVWLALACWVIGLALYAALIVAIVARVRSTDAPPARFTPDDWIVMGALAISTLAATALLSAEPAGRTRALVAPAAVLTWAVASSAVAPLGMLHLRRLLRDRAARRYQARWWAAVFPLGMYSVATDQLAVTLGMHPLESVVPIAFWVALGAWSLTAALAVGAARWSIAPPG